MTGGRYNAPPRELTPREIAVLMLVAEGWNTKSIAGRLGISEHTVQGHFKGIVVKVLGDERDDGKHPRVAVVLRYLSWTRKCYNGSVEAARD